MENAVINQISSILLYRERLFQLISELPNEKLEVIPDGHKNNIIWNFGHILSTQQLLNYARSGLDTLVPEHLLTPFRKGTFPEKGMSSLLPELQKFWLPTLERLKKDYVEKRFENFESYTTSAGIPLNCIEDAIFFDSIHESLHQGMILSMMKDL